MCAYEMIAHVCIQYPTQACVYAVLPIYYEYALVQATYTHKLVMAVAHKRLPPRSILSVTRRDVGPKHSTCASTKVNRYIYSIYICTLIDC